MKKLYISLGAVALVIIGFGIYKTNLNKTDALPENQNTQVGEVEENIDIKNVTKEPEPEIVKDFEGEADPARMTLSMQTWTWINTTYSDGKVVTPKVAKKFTINFKKDKTFSATTDCNGVGGEYKVVGNKITLTKMMSTLMYCEGSQEQEFNKMLNEIDSFMFTSKGEMVLLLKYDSGSVVFK